MSSPSAAHDADASAHPPPPSSPPRSDLTSSPAPLTSATPAVFPLAHGPIDALESTSVFPSLFPPQSSPFTPEALHALLSSFQAFPGSGPLPFPPLVPLSNPIPLQFLPPGTVLVPLCSLPGPSPLVRRPSIPHPKLLTFSSSSIVHMDVPSSVGAGALAAAAMGAVAVEAAMELTSPISPASDASTASSSPLSDSSDEERRGRGKALVSGGKRSRVSPYSETESDDSSDGQSSDGSDLQLAEAKKRRCVVSAQKLPTDVSHLELTMSAVFFQHHSIRIIHTHDRATGQQSTYVHGADVGGVIERKSNISRMFGQFESPREKVLMNVTGKHNHTVGQEANVLTVEGVKRLMGLKKCQPNAEYQHWLRDVLVPRLQEGQGGSAVEAAGSAKASSEPWAALKVEGKEGKAGGAVSEGDHSPLDLIASVCV